MNIIHAAIQACLSEHRDKKIRTDYRSRLGEITESTNPMDLIAQFHQICKQRRTYSTKSDYDYFGIRDNCGQACIDFIEYARSKGVVLKRVEGYFLCDHVLSSKKDFTKPMISELRTSGLDFNSEVDRKKFLDTNPKYAEEWKLAPHYWCVDDNGQIYDPSAYMQFIKTRLSTDLSRERYKPT